MVDNMTKKEFFNSVSNGKKDILQQFLDLLEKHKIKYCVIGGLAVNAYVEPVVSLDLDIVIVAAALKGLITATERHFKVEKFSHSYNLSTPKSALRIQLQTDTRYQEYIPRAASKEVMGYMMNVALLEDVLQGKVWAYCDEQRRRSKRQKDLADISRIVEFKPALKTNLPDSIKTKLV